MNFNDFATRKSRRERKVIVAGRWFDGLRSPNGVVISPDMLPQFFVSIASGTTAFSLRFHLAPSKTGGARGRRCAPVCAFSMSGRATALSVSYFSKESSPIPAAIAKVRACTRVVIHRCMRERVLASARAQPRYRTGSPRESRFSLCAYT